MKSKPARSSSPRAGQTTADAPLTASDHWCALRIVDANLNRTLEGLRVVEEFLRFALEDAYLARLCKQLRHEVAAWAEKLPLELLHRSRDTGRDIGTSIGTASEYRRASVRAVAAANCKRVQQGLRVLEEYGKIIAPGAAPVAESLRYRVYLLERAITATQSSLERLAQARLYVLLDGRSSREEFVHVATALLQGGADVIQLRDKRLCDRELQSRARQLRALTRQHGALLIINDRPDLAVLSDADGVHVGQEELLPAQARRVVGPERLIGVSTRNVEQARQAVLDGADYVGCGPTFPSRTKAFESFPGLEFLAQVHAEIRIPAFAIGGISHENVRDVCRTGVQRVAVRDCLLAAGDVREATQRLCLLLEQAAAAGNAEETASDEG